MGILKQMAEYLYIRKPDPNRPKSDFVKYMHGINRLSLFLFIMALIILMIKLLVKH
jgi:cob(I)alamin adenosyltransferase